MSLDGYDVIEIAMDSYDEPSDATVAQDGLIGEATDTSALNPPATPGPDATENMVDGVVIVQELGPADAPVVGEAAIATEFLSTVSPREPSPCADDEPAYSSNSWSEEDERDLKESIEAVVEAVSRRVSEVLLSAPAFIPATISIQAPDEPLGGYPSSDSDEAPRVPNSGVKQWKQGRKPATVVKAHAVKAVPVAESPKQLKPIRRRRRVQSKTVVNAVKAPEAPKASEATTQATPSPHRAEDSSHSQDKVSGNKGILNLLLPSAAISPIPAFLLTPVLHHQGHGERRRQPRAGAGAATLAPTGQRRRSVDPPVLRSSPYRRQMPDVQPPPYHKMEEAKPKREVQRHRARADAAEAAAETTKQRVTHINHKAASLASSSASKPAAAPAQPPAVVEVAPKPAPQRQSLAQQRQQARTLVASVSQPTEISHKKIFALPVRTVSPDAPVEADSPLYFWRNPPEPTLATSDEANVAEAVVMEATEGD